MRIGSRRSEWLARAGLLIGSCLLVFLLAEGALRLLKPESTNLNRMATVYRPDPELGFRYVPRSRGVLQRLEYRVEVELNSAGFFDDEFSVERRPGVSRIVVLGDSFTVGFEVGRGRNFPDALERLLNDSGTEAGPWEVYNLGMDGIGTVEESLLFDRDAVAYRPDVVLLAFYRNDFYDVAKGVVHRDVYRDHVLIYRTAEERELLIQRLDRSLSGSRRLLRAGVQHSYLVRALWARWAHHFGWPWVSLNRNVVRGELETRESRDLVRHEIIARVESMADDCRSRGCRFIFVALPTKDETNGEGSWAAGEILDELSSRGVETVSLLPPFRERAKRGEQLYWRLDAHCNAAGYEVIATELASYLDKPFAPEP
ncbi:MAG: hypothetical protein GY719_10915 [bacterium]|nr:hypothetical protein [bacterium]